MPCAYHIDVDAGLITLSGREAVNLADLTGTVSEMLGDALFMSSLPQLIDLRGLLLSRTVRSTRCFREFMLLQYQPRVHANVAIVVDDILSQRSLASLYLLVTHIDVAELFDHYELALRWLMRKEFAVAK